VEFVVVGAGAIGGTVGARLLRDGHDVLFCDVDGEHVAAINEHGLTIEGPLEQFTVEARAVVPADLPAPLGAVLLEALLRAEIVRRDGRTRRVTLVRPVEPWLAGRAGWIH